MTRISLAAACIVLMSTGAAVAQTAGHESVVPLHQIFNVAAYPFGQLIPSSANTGEFIANGVPKDRMDAEQPRYVSTGTGM